MALVILGRQFHKGPWELRRLPADEIQYWMNILSVEGEYNDDARGLGPDDPLYDDDDE